MVSIKTTIYNKFRGVDFSSDPCLVDKSRSPDAQNVITDGAGTPEKRMGWRTVTTAPYGGVVKGLFSAAITGEKYLVAHIGSSMYLFDPEAETEAGRLTLLLSNLGGEPKDRSVSVNLNNKLWILTGSDYLYFDGATCGQVSDIAYVPTTLIGCYPAGGGEFFEAVNMLTGKRKNEFIADGTSKDYFLESGNISNVEVWVDGVKKIKETDFTVNSSQGKVTFVTAPPAPAAGQEATVVIQFEKSSNSASQIKNCKIMTSFGVGSRDRIVVSGNRSYPNRDWISGYNDPSYMPDTGYSSVGSEATAIMGYAPIGAYQAIIKEDNGQDSTIYLRSATLDENGDAAFPVAQGVSGVGAIAKGAIGLINDEPVFLSSSGLYGLTSNIITAERMVQNRSYYVDALLTKEPDLENTVSCSWMGYFLLCINNRCYVIDGRQPKTYWQRSNGEFVYECHYWTNIPASCFLVRRTSGDEQLWFGTTDGRICRFNSDREGMDRYSDDGAAITARWSTAADDDGDPTVQKTMLKQGCAVTLKPYSRSSSKIFFRTDRDAAQREIRGGLMDIFDFGAVDFSRWSFNCNDGAGEVFFRQKVKKYKRLQIGVVNDAVNEGFGIVAITKHFVTGNFAKK